MTNIIKKFDKYLDITGLKETENNSYRVKVEKMDLEASKKGKPMFSIYFKIVGKCENKDKLVLFNYPLENGFQVNTVNEFLRALTEEVTDAPEIEFDSYKQYGGMILDIFELVNGNYEFALEYGENKKGYNTFKITETYELKGDGNEKDSISV